MDIRSQIAQLQQKIDRLEHSFNMYFTGQDRIPPVKMLQALAREVSHLMTYSDKLINSGEKFMLDSFVQRFTSYRIKWERGVRDIEEGRSKPGLHFFGGLGINHTQIIVEELSKKRGDEKKKGESAELSGAAEKFLKLSKEHLGKTYNQEAIELKLREKLSEIKEKYGENFTLDVYFDGEKVKIRTAKK